MRSPIEARQVPLGNLVFKVLGVALLTPLAGLWLRHVQPVATDAAMGVVLFHLLFNVLVAAVFIGLTPVVARWVVFLLPKTPDNQLNGRQQHLDLSALATPSVALACAVREAMHQSNVVETMLRGVLDVIQSNDLALAQSLQKMDDTVDRLYSDIKYYLTKMSRESLSEKEGHRWAEIISFTINMEQIGDIIERILGDIEKKKIKAGRNFSEAGMAEIIQLHGHLVDNLQLGMSVFLNGNLSDARKLLEEKTRFRDMELIYSANHITRLADNTLQSIETSSLHLDLISDFKRINSHISSIAYPILDSAGALEPSRLRHSAQEASASPPAPPTAA